MNKFVKKRPNIGFLILGLCFIFISVFKIVCTTLSNNFTSYDLSSFLFLISGAILVFSSFKMSN